MNEHVTMTPRHATDKPLSLAVLAMGGQGGGVLADWIVSLAEENGWMAQTTSVPGVAQRTGATIYYIEMLPTRDGKAPIFSLMPTPGDVDVVLAAELMEAGRSGLRGLVTPDKTVLIASTHRAFAVSEKQAPGDGAGNPLVVIDATDFAAKKTIAFDMDKLAVEKGSVISSALFGALAAADVLPFARQAFEATIRAGGKGIEASLRAFDAAYARAKDKPAEKLSAIPEKRLDPLPASAGHAELDRLLARIRNDFPDASQAMLFAGVKRLTDFQDPAYAGEYLDRMAALHALDRQHDGETKEFSFTAQAAKYLAVAMAYDDVIRVADLKARQPLRPGAPRGRRQGRPDRLHDRIHASTHGRDLRHAAEILGPVDRKSPNAVQAARQCRQQGPAGEDRHAVLVPRPLRCLRPAPHPPRHATPPARDGAPRRMAGESDADA